MKHIRLFVALLAAACIFVVPAFSMPENGNGMQNADQLTNGPCPDCTTGPMTQCQQNCDCQNARFGPDGDNGPQSMMGGKMECPCGQEARMGPNGNNGPRSMMGGVQQNSCCQNENAKMGPDGNCGPQFGTNGAEQNPCGQNDRVGPNGNNNGPQSGN
jgi:hypothetical protein